MQTIDVPVQITYSLPATQAAASLTLLISVAQEVRQIHRQSDHFGIFDTDIHATYFITFVPDV
jgi:type III secretory pathway component EscS